MNGKPRDGNAAAGLRTVDQARRSLERERGRADQRKARPVQSWPLRENVINQERQSGVSLRGGPNFPVLVVHRVVPAKLATRKSDGFILRGKRSYWLAARAHEPACPRQ
jgi:hypothetical protein